MWRRLFAFVLCAVLGILSAVPAVARSSITLAELDHYDAQKKSIQLPNGLSLAYMDIGARNAPALVLIHGYTDSGRDWAPLAPLLQSRFRLIIVDLRGHGASSK